MTTNSGSLTANVVDVARRRIRLAEVSWTQTAVDAVTEIGEPDPAAGYLIPGFVDAHVHVESSLLTPSEFARAAVVHGTVAAVSDPHEIGNVLGVEGVRWMLADAARTPFTILFGAPSCVPSTAFETSGAKLDAAEVEQLLDLPGVGYLTEMMDYPGVLAGEPSVLAKIRVALDRGYPVDGHAPGLRGADARKYIGAGITTDHECASLEEAEEKLLAGMRILIREGSAARNFDALHPLISKYPGRTMLCTDDLDAADLANGHIDRLVARAIAAGHDVFTVLEAACLTPRQHYGLDVGGVRPGERFTAVLLDDLVGCRAHRVWLAGELVAEDGQCLLPRSEPTAINAFGATAVQACNLAVPASNVADQTARCRVITATDGALITGCDLVDLPVVDGYVQPDPDADVLLVAVVNRYRPAPLAVGFIRGFGFRRGAIASSVAHDSHNIIGVGVGADALAAAINAVIEQRGGLSLADGQTAQVLPLPIAGLMSDLDASTVAERFGRLNDLAGTRLGSPLRRPFMTAAFMSLLVIPSLKLSDLGLFDVDRFELVDVACRT